MGLTKTAEQILRDMAPAKVDDLCNALAGMGPTERNDFVKAMVARAPEPMKAELSLSIIEEWWEQKIRTGVTLSARKEEGWLRDFPVAELTDDYVAFTKRTCFTNRGNATSMGRFLNKVMPTRKTSSRKAHIEVQAGEAGGEQYRKGFVAQVKCRVRHYHFVGHDAACGFWREYLAQRG